MYTLFSSGELINKPFNEQIIYQWRIDQQAV